MQPSSLPTGAPPAPAGKRGLPKWLILGAVAVIALICGGLGVAMSSVNATQDEFRALADACQGRGVSAAAAYQGGPAAAMGIQTHASGNVSVYPYAVADDSRPQTLGETEVVVCIDEPKEVLVERCPYGKVGDDPESVDGVVERYQFEQRLRLVVARTGEVVAETTLQGEAPRACLERETFRRGQETITAKGAEVTNAAMQAWVREMTAGS